MKLDPNFTNKASWHYLFPSNPNIRSKQALVLKSKQMVLLASEIIAWSNTKLVTILSVVLDTGLDCTRVSTIAFNGTIDGSNGCTKTLAYNWTNIGHPKPQGGLKRNSHVCSNSFRRV